MQKLQIGTIHADGVTLAQALGTIVELVRSGQGGYVVTPNVDHVVLAEKNAELRNAYALSSLSLADGMPIIWLSHLLGRPLPQKLSGSDMVRPLCATAAAERLRVYLLGGEPGIGEAAATRLTRDIPGLAIAGIDAPPLGFDQDQAADRLALEKVITTHPHLVLVALGCPKQELLMCRWRDAVKPAVMVGVGAGLDFVAERVKRAPHWMSALGVEWTFRLLQEPRRMAKRYLVRDMAMLPIAYRTWRSARASRA